MIVISILLFFYTKKNKSESFELNPEFNRAIDLLQNGTDHLFITGNAGTGKSTLIRHYINSNKRKSIVLLAPTGIAALNIGGQTIHSFFRFRPTLLIPNDLTANYANHHVFNSIDEIIIDEISMVRADLIDAIDKQLQLNRNNLTPFGGVRLIFVGDIFQLPPVIADNETRNYINNNYDSEYFFSAKVFSQIIYHVLELKKNYRQTDRIYIDILNRIRNGQQTFDDMVAINRRSIPNITPPNSNIITLTTTNEIARQVNIEKLNSLRGNEREYIAIISGSFERTVEDILRNNRDSDSKLPTEYKLKLKIGSQIMIIKNDPQKRWVNGSLGTVVRFFDDSIEINLNGTNYMLRREKWSDIRYEIKRDNDVLEPVEIGSFEQFPIKLAWAITIHKSQGKTFQSAIVDFGNGTFAPGQAYVALSRVKSINGVYLRREFRDRDVLIDPKLTQYLLNAPII